MLNYANDIYVLDQSFNAEKKDEHIANFNIFWLTFCAEIRKAASVLGFPKAYREQIHRGYDIKGQIDIQHLITHNIPIRKPLQSKFRDQVAVQEVIDVLFKATKIISKEV